VFVALNGQLSKIRKVNVADCFQYIKFEIEFESIIINDFHTPWLEIRQCLLNEKEVDLKLLFSWYEHPGVFVIKFPEQKNASKLLKNAKKLVWFGENFFWRVVFVFKRQIDQLGLGKLIVLIILFFSTREQALHAYLQFVLFYKNSI
jgi:hypothetical protein